MFLSGKTRDPHNLFHNCQLRSIKNLQWITLNELKTKFFLCKHNIELLKQNSPYFCSKFLKSIVTRSKMKGDAVRASKVTGIIQKEASRKR